MALESGTQLGHYEITAPIGKGGMGEVYRARDARLGREVAIKVLPSEFAQDEERLARLEREARMLAALNHPNIAAIHGLEESSGTRFLVLELVEGDTLGDRLKRGAIPVEESLRLALQIAEALEAAHEKGVVHRDLKPANIKITSEGRVKVLDFGLAKAFIGDHADVNLSNSPTLSMHATRAGIILGTAAYMSPEQASGEVADQRSDVWSFGVVLFEMLTGSQLFTGKTASHVMGAVLEREPDWSRLPSRLHPRLRALLERLLEKEPRDRLSGISDARVEIQKVLSDPAGVTPHPAAAAPDAQRAVLPLIATFLVGLLVAGSGVWYLTRSGESEPEPIGRFIVETPSDGPVLSNTAWNVLAASPDGSLIAFVSAPNGVASRQIYIRRIDELESTVLRGTEGGGIAPFFSPDGESLGFVSDVAGLTLSRVSVLGGPPTTIGTFSGSPYGMDWTKAGDILFTVANDGRLMKIASSGGEAEELTTLDEAAGETEHMQPTLLPDGDTVLFTIVTAGQSTLARMSLATREVTRLGIPGSAPRYLPTGHVVYAVEDGTLRALPFDLSSLQFTSTNPIPVVENFHGGSRNDARNFSVSSRGTLVYLSGLPVDTSLDDRVLAIVTDDGRIAEEVDVPPRPYLSPRVSPNGELLAVQITNPDGTSDIWIKSLVDDSRIRQLTLDGHSSRPVWTPDGRRVTYASVADGAPGIFWQPIDGGGAERLTETEGQGQQWPESWSPDGRTLGFTDVPPSGDLTGQAVWVYSLDDDTTMPLPVLMDIGSGGITFSSDGNWFAYHASRSEEAVPTQVYVQPWPPTGTDIPVTPQGGSYAVFSPGNRLTYRRAAPVQASVTAAGSNPTEVVSIDLRTDAGVTFGEERTMSFPGLGSVFGFRDFDPMPDGRGFLMALFPDQPDVQETAEPKINVVLNWVEELKERVPVP